jgi:hypothetical protein
MGRPRELIPFDRSARDGPRRHREPPSGKRKTAVRWVRERIHDKFKDARPDPAFVADRHPVERATHDDPESGLHVRRLTISSPSKKKRSSSSIARASRRARSRS